MVRLPVRRSSFSDPNVCEVSSPSTTYLMYYQRNNDIDVFMVNSYAAGSSSITNGNYLDFGRVKCKHFDFNPVAFFFHNQNGPSYRSTYSLYTTNYNSVLTAQGANLVYVKSDVQKITASAENIFMLFEFDVSSWVAVSGLTLTDGMNFHTQLTFTSGALWSAISSCSAPLGFANSKGSAVGCTSVSSTSIVVNNFDGLVPSLVSTSPGVTVQRHLIRVQLRVTTNAASQFAPASIGVKAALYASPEAQVAADPIIESTITVAKEAQVSVGTADYVMFSLPHNVAVDLLDFSSSVIQLVIDPGSTVSGFTDNTNHIDIWFNMIDIGSCSVTNVELRLSSSRTLGTGSLVSSQPSSSCSGSKIRLTYSQSLSSMFGTSSLSSSNFLLLKVQFAASPIAQPPERQNWVKVNFVWQGQTSSTYSTRLQGESDGSLSTATIPPLANAASIAVLSTNAGRATELYIELQTLKFDTKASENMILGAEITGTASWSGHPFSYTDTAVNDQRIDCLCQIGSHPLPATFSYSRPDCHYHKVGSSHFITVQAEV